ncbi:LIC_13387 family protein [Ralstonia sp. 24A2]|uniref:LIC_13387 family protein n=1 Tax=Ralstonia sp. 24A2 TaxID=3447364 RepID=UPI003F69A5F8
MTANTLMLISAGYLLCVGMLHLVLTLTGKLNPQDPDLRVRMKQTPLALLKRTDMWSCWTGFNASHSIALMLFGLFYGFLAAKHSQLLFGSSFLLAVGLTTIVSFVVLGTVYWFRRPPYIVLGVPLASYVASLFLAGNSLT